MKNKILIADDHQLFGNGLKELLQKSGNFEVFGPIKEEEEIKQALLIIRPSILLLDINLGGINGIELGTVLKKDFPDLGIIMLTMYENARFLSQSIKANLDGYLLKDCETKELVAGIDKVLKGEKCFIKIASEPDENKQFKDNFLTKYNITERELEIINHLKNGETNEEIAKKLTLSFHTVKTHRKNIYLKLSVSNLAGLIDFLNQLP
jgi:DNA-binding NarL/FixJ family response regulator